MCIDLFEGFLITPKDLVYYAKRRGLNAVAVTDHNQLEGAYKIAKETDFLVIPGMKFPATMDTSLP